jgi:hypothetical protein
MSIGLASLIKYYPKFSFLTLVVVSICYIILLINEFVKMIRRRNNGVFISTNDARSITIYDHKEDYVDEIISKVYEVMENQEENVSYHYKMKGISFNKVENLVLVLPINDYLNQF